VAETGAEVTAMKQTIDLNDRHALQPAELDARHWTALGRYREPILVRSLAELIVTAIRVVALWFAMLLGLRSVGIPGCARSAS
jgi:hypothetical protein